MQFIQYIHTCYKSHIECCRSTVDYIMACAAVMEYIPCGELFALWKKLHNFSESLVQLYIAELGMVIGL